MDLLLDTHALIWWDQDDVSLSLDAASAIADENNQVFVSAAAIWEIAIKRRLGRLDFSKSVFDAVLSNGFKPLNITGEDAEAAAALPPIHQDPFDRMMIAQAMINRLVLVTADHYIKQYAVPQISARQ